jgi:hypothetical protein
MEKWMRKMEKRTMRSIDHQRQEWDAREERAPPEEVVRGAAMRSGEWVVPGFGWGFFLPRWIGGDWNELRSIQVVAKYANLHRQGWMPSRAFSSPRGRDSDSIPVNPCLSKRSLKKFMKGYYI